MTVTFSSFCTQVIRFSCYLSCILMGGYGTPWDRDAEVPGWVSSLALLLGHCRQGWGCQPWIQKCWVVQRGFKSVQHALLSTAPQLFLGQTLPMVAHKWTLLIPNPSWYIDEVLCTLLVTSLDLCYLKSLYSPTLHEIDLALVIVIHNLHFTCLRSFASGTGMRHICFAGVSQSANVPKIRSFKARLQQSFAP